MILERKINIELLEIILETINERLVDLVSVKYFVKDDLLFMKIKIENKEIV